MSTSRNLSSVKASRSVALRFSREILGLWAGIRLVQSQESSTLAMTTTINGDHIDSTAPQVVKQILFYWLRALKIDSKLGKNLHGMNCGWSMDITFLICVCYVCLAPQAVTWTSVNQNLWFRMQSNHLALLCIAAVDVGNMGSMASKVHFVTSDTDFFMSVLNW